MTRKYPERPIVGVGAVIFIESRVVLVKRKFEPAAGTWSLPGGAVEVGETAARAVVREIREETGLTVEPGPVLDVVDRILTDEDGRVAYHYVVIDYLCEATGGALAAGSDVVEVALAEPAALEAFGVSDAVRQIVSRGLEVRR